MSTDVDPGKPGVLVSGDFLLESIKLIYINKWVVDSALQLIRVKRLLVVVGCIRMIP